MYAEAVALLPSLYFGITPDAVAVLTTAVTSAFIGLLVFAAFRGRLSYAFSLGKGGT